MSDWRIKPHKQTNDNSRYDPEQEIRQKSYTTKHQCDWQFLHLKSSQKMYPQWQMVAEKIGYQLFLSSTRTPIIEAGNIGEAIVNICFSRSFVCLLFHSRCSISNGSYRTSPSSLLNVTTSSYKLYVYA